MSISVSILRTTYKRAIWKPKSCLNSKRCVTRHMHSSFIAITLLRCLRAVGLSSKSFFSPFYERAFTFPFPWCLDERRSRGCNQRIIATSSYLNNAMRRPASFVTRHELTSWQSSVSVLIDVAAVFPGQTGRDYRRDVKCKVRIFLAAKLIFGVHFD